MEYVLTLIEGLASFVSPCLLPMVPIYISYFAGDDISNKSKKIKNCIGFVLGFTIVFLILSILASKLGGFINASIKYIKILFGIIVILLGLNYIGVLRMNFLNKSKKVKADVKNLNFIKSVMFGILFSISWTPCIGTFLSSALILIAGQQDILKGIILMLLYCVGMGIPFILSVFLIEQLKDAFDFIKRNYGAVKKVSGAILVIMGLYIIFF